MAGVEVFDRLVQRYEAWFDLHKGVWRSELEAFRALMPEFKRGLEVGVGTGRFAWPLGITYGIDPSEGMLHVALSRNIQVVQGVAEQLPFASSMFDVVLLSVTLCFVDSPSIALEEAFRALRPGGVLLIGFVDLDSPLGRDYERRRFISPFYKEAAFFSFNEVAGLLASAGFMVEKVLQTITSLEISEPEKPIAGHGERGFVVIRALRPES